MLAVALNNVGVVEDENFGLEFVKLFKDFKVIKISPYDDLKKGRLQLCEPEEYEELIKNIQKSWDASGTFLELKGLKAKLQKAVRQMFFFDEERIYEKVLLEGRDGMDDFPWAIQIVMVHQPVPAWEQNSEWIKRADILVLNDLKVEESRDIIARVKMIRPNIAVFTEKLQEGLSKELQDGLESLFAAYLEKRKKIKMMLEEKQVEQSITCEQARRMAGKLRVNWFLFGNVCDECGYSITRCSLGCF